MERAKNENDILREAVSKTFSNVERVEEKVEAERATINNLLEKMNTMEKRSKERLTKLMKDHKAEIKRAKSNNDITSSGGRGYQGGGGGGGSERDSEKARYNRKNSSYEERQNFNFSAENRATIRLKWEKRLASNLDRPGSGLANK